MSDGVFGTHEENISFGNSTMYYNGYVALSLWGVDITPRSVAIKLLKRLVIYNAIVVSYSQGRA